MKYLHRFRVRAPLADVRDFHRRSASMGAITPPPMNVRVHRAPLELSNGDEMTFTLWIGPLPIHWHARIDQMTATSFRDLQLSGPFAAWVHTHTFTVLDEQTTEVLDEVEAVLPSELGRRLLALGMWLSLPVLFAYRAWKTRWLLESTRRIGETAASAP